MRDIIACPMLVTCNRILDGFCVQFIYAVHNDATLPSLHICFNGDGLEERLMVGRGHGIDHPTDGRHIFRVLPGKDFFQRLTLLGGSLFVNNYLQLTIALMNWSGPFCRKSCLQTVK